MIVGTVIGQAHGSGTMLECELNDGVKEYFRIDIDLHRAEHVAAPQPIAGQLITTDDRYKIVLPKTEIRRETHIKIQRYSGEMFWEHGNEPFGVFDPDTVFRSGTCRKVDAIPPV